MKEITIFNKNIQINSFESQKENHLEIEKNVIRETINDILFEQEKDKETKDKLLKNILFIIDELLANSINADSKNIKIRIKYNEKDNHIIVTVGDDGKIQKMDKKDEVYIGKTGITSKNIELSQGLKIKLLRSDIGSLASARINIKMIEKE